MESTSQPQPAPPCLCQQQIGGLLPWLVFALAIIVALDRWGRRRKNKSEKTDGTATGDAHHGGST